MQHSRRHIYSGLTACPVTRTGQHIVEEHDFGTDPPTFGWWCCQCGQVFPKKIIGNETPQEKFNT